MTIWYTGIGSRNTPPGVLELMVQTAERLADLGYGLRSGAAQGADSAFEEGCDRKGGAKEIYLPFKGFQSHRSLCYPPSQEALGLAARYHPNWMHLSGTARALMARNMHQVLGADLNTPSRFILCWTPDGCQSLLERSSSTGGTGQAIALASDRSIPVFNLARQDMEQRIHNFLAHSTPKRGIYGC